MLLRIRIPHSEKAKEYFILLLLWINLLVKELLLPHKYNLNVKLENLQVITGMCKDT
jgi:hypothetical protein